MLTRNETEIVAKVTDFGFSKSELSSYLSVSSAKGTIGYSAPELIRRVHSHTGAFDIFSFGCILTFMFGKNHRHPFSDMNFTEYCILLGTWNAFLSSRMESKIDLPEEVYHVQNNDIRQIIVECLDVNPANRPNAEHLILRIGRLIERESESEREMDETRWKLQLEVIEKIQVLLSVVFEHLDTQDDQLQDHEEMIETLKIILTS